MIYRPPLPRRMWDSWLFPWQGRFHLFHLETHETLWDHVGHAVSADLVHWEARPSIPTKGDPGAWNEKPTLTGMVVRHAGRFWMFVGADQAGRQVVGVMTSDDLDHWRPHPASPVMRPSGPFYLSDPAPPVVTSVDWRDPCVRWVEAARCFEACLCARLPRWDHGHTGACVARLRSADLLRWEALPPLAVAGDRFMHMEVPDVFELGGRHYLLFSTVSVGGIRLDTPSRERTKGTYCLVADAYEGPYRLPEDPLVIGAGQGRVDAYVGRTIPWEDGRLLYHHIAGARPTFGSPKRVRQEADGALGLEYLPALERLETGVIVESIQALPAEAAGADLGCWERAAGRLTGTAACMGSSIPVAADVADFHLQCTVAAGARGRAGVLFRCADRAAGGVALDFQRSRVEVGRARVGSLYGPEFDPLDGCRRPLPADRPVRWRLWVRDVHAELYLDDRWVFTTVLPDLPPRGEVRLAVEAGSATWESLRLAAIEPLP